MTWTSLGYRKARRALKMLVWLALPALINLWLIRTIGAQAVPAQVANDVNVAAAADMEPVFAVVGPVFEKQTGLHLKISFASSATLAQQIQQGSPADIFFSADFFFAEQLVASNLTENRKPTPYAKGLLVLYARNDSPLKPLSVDLLQRKDLKAVAIANPDRAPYGRAAIAALKQMKLYENVAPHIVQAESVAQAAQFALSGNAELALISQTLAVSPKYKAAGTYALVPLSQYPDISQCAVILKGGKNVEGAHRLLNFILSDQVQTHLKDLGLQSVQ
jgi:molybdate transport system substrate-binding protein